MAAREWWPVAFIFSVVALLLLFVFLADHAGRRGEAETAQAEAGGEAPPVSPEEFWQGLAENAPHYGTAFYECPVDGTQLEIPTLTMGNRLGGVATDLMNIMLAPAAAGAEPPELDVQSWEKLLGTSPTSGATYMEIDLYNIRLGRVPGAKQQLSGWSLADAAPALAAIPSDQWSGAERSLARYLTCRQAGFDTTELGFYALSGAYCANFDAYRGEPPAIPSPALYALAAAHLAQALGDDEFGNEEERGIVQMTLGELNRLLGRASEAQEQLAAARETLALLRDSLQQSLADPELEESARAVLKQRRDNQDQTLAVLDQLQQLAATGDAALQRAAVPGLPEPPVGWYLDKMLPAMNEHIAENRDAWAGEDDPEAILSRILQLL